MNLRICFDGLKPTKESQIAHLEEKLHNLDKESRYFSHIDEDELKKAIFDLKMITDEDFNLWSSTARDEVFFDWTESGKEID